MASSSNADLLRAYLAGTLRTGLPASTSLDNLLQLWAGSPPGGGVALPGEYGLTAWTGDLTGCQGGSLLATAGTVYLTKVWLPAGTYSNLYLVCTAPGATLTAGQCFAGLFNAAGTLLSATVDQSTPWQSAGWKQMALVTPQTITAGYYYLGMFYNGTTAPTFSRHSNSANSVANGNLVAPNLRYCTSDTGRTTTFASPFGAQTASLIAFWWGLS